MVVLQKRTQLVAFRVSEVEYNALLQSCQAAGARSLADFARDTVLQRTKAIDAQSGTLHGDLRSVAHTLGELDATLDLARRRIREVLGPAGEDDAGPQSRVEETTHSDPGRAS